MSVVSLDTLRHETRFALSLMRRYLGKRLATGAMILGLAALAGAQGAVPAIAAVILLAEVGIYAAQRLLPPSDAEVPLALALWACGLNVLSTVAYLLPALALAASAELQWVLAGLLWVFGVLVHLSNSYMALPLFNWSQMIPAFAVGFAALAVAGAGHGAWDAGGPGGSGAWWSWLIVLGQFLVYCVNTVETISTQKETQAELARARAEARARLAALERAARIDPLTGLLNRQAFDAALVDMLRAAGPGREVAVLSMDLDGFKPLNDTYGHAAGDAVLMVTGRRMAAFLGQEGAAGRLGGDELALAVPGIRSARMALDLAMRLAREVERPVSHDGKTLRVGGSVGVALSGNEADGGLGPAVGDGDADGVAILADRMVAAADRAMLGAKATARLGGEHRPVLYDPRSHPTPPTLDDRRRLAEALAGGEVRPAYAPIFDLATGALAGFDAEPVWLAAPSGGAPDAPGASGADDDAAGRAALLARIPELGLQGDLLVAMTRQVLEDLDDLVAEGLDPGRVGVAVPEMALATRSGRRDLDRLLAAHPLGRSRIALGLPGDVLAARAAEMVREGMAHLRAMGAGIAIHGFFTGQACFRHLRHVPLDELKVDASFVAVLGRDPSVQVAVEAVGVMARGLGARLVAEGIETDEQRRHLLRIGCGLGGGPLLGRPLDAAGLRRALLDGGQPALARVS